MGIKKDGYKGYKAFSYLTPGEDYEVFEFDKWDWVGRNILELDAQQEDRVLRLAKDTIYIAPHEHPTYFPKVITDVHAYNRAGREFCAYDALADSYIDCVFDNLMDGTCVISSKAGWKWQDILHDLGMRLCDIAHQDFLIHCKKVDDIYRAHAEGKIAWVAVIEGAAPIENEVDRIDVLYGLGVRQLGITYSESNALGNGLKEDNDGGLTMFGKKCVNRMNKVGMLIDISHCGPKTGLDTVMYSEKPILASHVGARALWNIKRLFDDTLLRAIAEKGGVISVEAAPHTTMTKNHEGHNIHSVMEHFEYIANMVGIDNVTIGTDALYGDHVGLHHAFAANLSKKDTSAPDHKESPFVWGLENPTEASWNYIRWFVKKGYSDEDIAKVLSGNVLRVLKQVWS